MRKLILEAQISIDGFMADHEGKTDWLIWNWGKDWTWDKDLQQYHNELTKTVDCIFLSRQLAEDGFIEHWAKIAEDPNNSQAGFAKHLRDSSKVIFSKTLVEGDPIPGGWENTEVSRWDVKEHIRQLKNQEGKDIIVYGGGSFISSLIQGGVIDEYHLLINPTILGKGLPIFNRVATRQPMTLTLSKTFECGVTLMRYQKERASQEVEVISTTH